MKVLDVVLLLATLIAVGAGFAPTTSFVVRNYGRCRTTEQILINGLRLYPPMAIHLYLQHALPIFAGSVAGALGVGVAFPFDTLKTKAQVLRQQQQKNGGHPTTPATKEILLSVTDASVASKNYAASSSSVAMANETTSTYSMDAGGILAYATTTNAAVAAMTPTSLQAVAAVYDVVVPAPVSSSTSATTASVAITMTHNTMNMLQLFRYVWEREGLVGLFAGVKGMMLGQAIIKALAFYVNAVAVAWLTVHHSDIPGLETLGPNAILFLGACFAGFCTSFPTAPIERVKVMMQAQTKPGTYRSDMDCYQAVLTHDGLGGLLTRGLGTTLLRETPSYGIYFGLYASLMTTPLAHVMPYPAAPLMFGALSGLMSWWPVYPVDVIKTIVQNTPGHDGNAKVSAWQQTQTLWREEGWSGFWDGIDAKMLRAAVNHAVTFYTYDVIMHLFNQQP